jgi:proteasome lid subunit RPN8/RPN11
MRGRYAITSDVIRQAECLLPTFRGSDGDHEGMLLLLGLEQAERSIFLSVAAPVTNHSRGSVKAAPEAVAAVSRFARSLGLAVLGQIHSHPAGSTEHSEGDDELVLMPFEGMLSIVVPHNARFGLRPLDSLGVHQYQDGRWTLVTGVRERFQIIPGGVDLRQ